MKTRITNFFRTLFALGLFFASVYSLVSLIFIEPFRVPIGKIHEEYVGWMSFFSDILLVATALGYFVFAVAVFRKQVQKLIEFDTQVSKYLRYTFVGAMVMFFFGIVGAGLLVALS